MSLEKPHVAKKPSLTGFSPAKKTLTASLEQPQAKVRPESSATPREGSTKRAIIISPPVPVKQEKHRKPSGNPFSII